MAGPLAADEVAALLAPAASAPAIALAVSGGTDSLALLAAADGWRRAAGRPRVLVLTVDHGLTRGSDAVAAAVAAAAAGRGLGVRVLAWEGRKPVGGLEAAARRARYALLLEAARAAGATHLLTAHSLEDQAETFLMRLARGSGVFGLAAIRPLVDAGGVVLFRPFLGVPRARLAATAAAAALAPHADPMNADPRFLRVRVRALLPALAAAGVAPEALSAAAARMAAAADAIDAAVDRFVAGHVTVDAFAVAALDADAFLAAPAEIRCRLLVRLLQALGGDDYPPRARRVAALAAALDRPVRRTLAGVVVERRGGRIRLWREVGRAGLAAMPVVPGAAVAWDHRFRVVAPREAAGMTVAALGRERPAGLAASPGLPAAARAALPALVAGGRLVAVPALGWGDAAGVSIAECVSERLARPPRFPVIGGAEGPAHAAAISA